MTDTQSAVELTDGCKLRKLVESVPENAGRQDRWPWMAVPVGEIVTVSIDPLLPGYFFYRRPGGAVNQLPNLLP